MSTTIRDVARHAGVSISTVSRVLNNTCTVHEDKRRSVIEAARALDYRPNPAARSLLGKKTGGIGVLMPYVSGEFFAEFLNGLDEAAQEDGLFLVVSTSHRHREEFNAAIEAMNKRVDALVVMAPELDERGVASILQSGGPVLFINTFVGDAAVDALNFENARGTYMLTKHLLDLGHRRIALIKGAPNAWDAKERARGYRMAMAEAGVATTAGLEFGGDYTQAAGYAAAQVILAATPRPTAIVSANDYCAAGALSALNSAGVSVPDEMAIAGFDDVPSAQYTVPPLTTVRVPIRSIGRRAIQQLMKRLGEKAIGDLIERETVPVELVVRGSTVKGAAGGTP